MISWLMARRKKLSGQELDVAIASMRERYDAFISEFGKPTKIRDIFEECYLFALKSKMDLAAFLEREEKTLEEMIAQEKSRKMAEKKNVPDFADRVILNLEQHIAKYPSRRFHRQASREMMKLCGALDLFKNSFWPLLEHFLRKNLLTSVLQKTGFDQQLWALAGGSKDHPPRELEHCCLLLSRHPHDATMIAKQERNYLVKASAFFHDLLALTQKTARQDPPSEGIAEAIDFMKNVLVDFRLQPLKE